jgi:hypothetical protein
VALLCPVQQDGEETAALQALIHFWATVATEVSAPPVLAQ